MLCLCRLDSASRISEWRLWKAAQGGLPNRGAHSPAWRGRPTPVGEKGDCSAGRMAALPYLSLRRQPGALLQHGQATAQVLGRTSERWGERTLESVLLSRGEVDDNLKVAL